MTTGIGMIGAAGRMGMAIQQIVADLPDATFAGVDVGGDVAALAQGCAVLIDFTAPTALGANLAAATAACKPIVIGTTGLEESHHRAIDDAARTIPVLWSANMSLGVNLLAALVRQAAERLGDDWDIEILEMHHRHKVDAPSGTALLLGRAAAAGRKVALADKRVSVRDGITGMRRPGDIGFATLRGGSVAGDHSVIFAADQERIELVHRAESRAIFARGAVRAALWLAAQQPGRYAMTDVLGMTA